VDRLKDWTIGKSRGQFRGAGIGGGPSVYQSVRELGWALGLGCCVFFDPQDLSSLST